MIYLGNVMKPTSLIFVFLLSLPATVFAGLEEDFVNAINQGVIPEVGQSMQWAGGTLIRTKKGVLRYSGGGCAPFEMEADSDPVSVAKVCPAVNEQWKKQYGIDSAATAQATPAVAASPIPAPAYASAANSNVATNQTDYSKMAFKSAMAAFSVAAKKYDKGEITKEQFISAGLSLSKLYDYAGAGAGVGEEKIDMNSWHEINQAITPKMREDYAAYFKSTAIGSVVDWAGGKLYRRIDGALFVGADGDTIFLNDTSSGAPDFNNIALMNESIAKLWKDQYGFKAVGTTYYQSQRGFSSSSFTDKMSETQWYSKAYGINILNWLKSNYNSMKIGDSKKWESKTIIRNGSPFCLTILSENGAERTSLCQSDDFDKNLPNNPYATKLAIQYWGYKP